jgi:hypothetical protein
MKAILEFNLPDDEEEYGRTVVATELCSILFDMDNYLRERLKYGELKSADEELEDARQKLSDLMNEEAINLDKIYK